MRKALASSALAFIAAAVVAAAAPGGDGPGFTTSQAAMLEGAAPGVTYTPIISVGDTLASGYRFESIPDGISLWKHGNGTVDLYVNHETSLVPFPVQGVSGPQTLHDYTNAILSKLRLHKTGGVLQGWYAIPSEANFQRFCSNFLATEEHGFERPMVLTNEEATDFVNRTGVAWPPGPGAEQAGVVVAYDVRSGKYRAIYGMGRHNHENSVAIPGYGYPVVLSGDDTFTSNPAQSQLYSYIAEDADAVWNDEGELYGLVLDDANVNDYYDYPVGTSMSKTGSFVKIDKNDALGDQTRLENASDALGVFQFVRVEDVAYDRRPGMQNVVYVVDSGRGATSPGGNPFTSSNGRVWKLVLDPANPKRVLSLSILIEGDDAPVKAPGEIHQPDNIESTVNSLLIQEDPGSSQQFVPGEANATTARIWQFPLDGSPMRVVARVNQSADGGPGDADAPRPPARLGAWESSGIVDASSVFGPGAFLLDVQAGTYIVEQQVIRPDGPDADNLPDEVREREGGQLGLLRIPGA
jgi:hypothetical protein